MSVICEVLIISGITNTCFTCSMASLRNGSKVNSRNLILPCVTIEVFIWIRIECSVA